MSLYGTHRLIRDTALAMRDVIAILMLAPALAIAVEDVQANSENDFYITITANELCLCGEGFGGIYGCIDEAISREAKSVVIYASSEASPHGVQELIDAVHSVGFDQVGFDTFYESDT